MASRRHLRKEEKEELKRQKKELKKSYEKTRSESKRVGTKRFSDTQRYLLVGSVAAIIIVILAMQFLIPPKQICYFTERDFVYATLGQDKSQADFSRIVAQYSIVAAHTTVNCDITDFFNSSFNLALPSPPVSTNTSNTILYQVSEVSSSLIWATPMIPSKPAALPMALWINKTEMTVSPSSFAHDTPTYVTFRLAITPQIHVDYYNASLQFNQTIPSTTISLYTINNGTFYLDNGTAFTQGTNLSAKSTILLDFTLVITSSLIGKLNLLQRGSVYLVQNGQLLSSFAFHEAVIDLTGFGLEQKPTVEKTKALDIVVNIPFYNVTLT
jgi:hypothetical protein